MAIKLFLLALLCALVLCHASSLPSTSTDLIESIHSLRRPKCRCRCVISRNAKKNMRKRCRRSRGGCRIRSCKRRHRRGVKCCRRPRKSMKLAPMPVAGTPSPIPMMPVEGLEPVMSMEPMMPEPMVPEPMESPMVPEPMVPEPMESPMVPEPMESPMVDPPVHEPVESPMVFESKPSPIAEIPTMEMPTVSEEADPMPMEEDEEDEEEMEEEY